MAKNLTWIRKWAEKRGLHVVEVHGYKGRHPFFNIYVKEGFWFDVQWSDGTIPFYRTVSPLKPDGVYLSQWGYKPVQDIHKYTQKATIKYMESVIKEYERGNGDV